MSESVIPLATRCRPCWRWSHSI